MAVGKIKSMQQERRAARSGLSVEALPSADAYLGLVMQFILAFGISFLMPVHGSAIGLSASTIGIIMGSFSAASFLMRMILPPLARHFDHWQVIKGSLVMGGVVFYAPLTLIRWLQGADVFERFASVGVLWALFVLSMEFVSRRLR